MFSYKLMYRSGLARKIDGTETVIDAIRKGIPVKEIVLKNQSTAENVQQNYIEGDQNKTKNPQQNDNSGNEESPPIRRPRVIRAGNGNRCPPGYTYALGYCVLDSDYHGCPPGEHWNGNSCVKPSSTCKEGQTVNPTTGVCVDRCPPEHMWSDAEKQCVSRPTSTVNGNNAPKPPSDEDPSYSFIKEAAPNTYTLRV